MIRCPECAKETDGQVPACPHCGTTIYVEHPADMLLISPGATAAYITELPQDAGKDYLFRTCPSDNLQGVVLGKLAASLYKSASVMYVNNPYGQGLAEQFRRSFHKRGGTVYMSKISLISGQKLVILSAGTTTSSI